jgi:hypothetical protein
MSSKLEVLTPQNSQLIFIDQQPQRAFGVQSIDASGGTSVDAHKYAMDRMVQVGVVPMTWQQVLLEWQRDWARRDTYDAVMAIAKEHSRAYGMGVDYAYTMVHKTPERVTHGPTLAPKSAA